MKFSWNSPGQDTGVGSLFPSLNLPNPGIEPRSPSLQADSLPAEQQGKPKNTGMGSLSLSGLPNPGVEPGSPALQEGEGNGNPLQCSCLENPMDGEAW